MFPSHDPSRRPGIGNEWLKRYHKQTYDWDKVVLRGQQMRPPKSYDRVLREVDPALYEEVKHARHLAAAEHHENQTPERLLVRETLQHARADLLMRKL